MTRADPVLEVDRLQIEIAPPAGTSPSALRVPASEAGLTLKLHGGEVVGLAGASGAGKSMAALAMIGLLPRNARVVAGSIRVLGCDPLHATADQLRSLRGRQVAIVFQDPQAAWNPVRSIGAQIAEAVRAHRDSSRDAARAEAVTVLARVGMKAPESVARAFPHQLSGGMRQRALIAMAIVHRPKLLIADEPTVQLDALSAQQVSELLKRLVAEDGMGLLLISHDRAQLASLADTVVNIR